MNLNKTNATVLFAQWKDSDDWIGKIVHIQAVQSVMTETVNGVPVQRTIFVWSVSIANQASRPKLPPNTDITGIASEVEAGLRKPPPGCVLRALGSGAGESPKQLSGTVERDERLWGQTLAKQVRDRLAERMVTFDEALTWLKHNDEESFDAMVGKDLPDLERWTRDSLANAVEGVLADRKRLEERKKNEPAIDVPF